MYMVCISSNKTHRTKLGNVINRVLNAQKCHTYTMIVIQVVGCHSTSDLVWPCGVYGPTQSKLRSFQTGLVYQEPKMASGHRCYQSKTNKRTITVVAVVVVVVVYLFQQCKQ